MRIAIPKAAFIQMFVMLTSTGDRIEIMLHWTI
jgi:hypothetical protein